MQGAVSVEQGISGIIIDHYFLTKEECHASLKEFSRGKSPGTDGLTAEFYRKFWKLLGQELVDSLNYAFEIGELSILQKRG